MRWRTASSVVRRLGGIVCMAMLLQALAPALTIAGARQAPTVLALVQPICSGAGNHASRLVVFEREAAARPHGSCKSAPRPLREA